MVEENIELNDEDAAKVVREFVRQNPDINVDQFIQRGNNGDVYFGKRIKMGDDVVLKFYWSHKNYDESEEAVVLNKIEHPNILKIYDLKFLAPYFAYFLTPKISGGDIQGVIDSRSISTKEALKITEGILLGLNELHAKHNLVHRDLKPGNILLDSETSTPIIADLGAIKKIQEANGHVTASKSTFYYLPPESIQDDKYYFQSDIYQVGIILYQLLGGKFYLEEPLLWFNPKEKKELEIAKLKSSTEWQKQFDKTIGDKILKGKLINTSTLPEYLDPEFKRVINKATNLDYKKRYTNPAFFMADIHSLLRKQPNYIKGTDDLIIIHDSGKQFRISKNTKGQIVLEKGFEKKTWRKDHSHKGCLQTAYKIVKKL